MSLQPADAVTLTDLEVIQRWSLAVRQASADRGEIIAALRADLDWLEGGRRGRITPDEPELDDVDDVDDELDGADESTAVPPAKRAAPRKPAAKKTPTKAAPRKAATTKSTRSATTRTASTRSGSTTRRSR